MLCVPVNMLLPLSQADGRLSRGFGKVEREMRNRVGRWGPSWCSAVFGGKALQRKGAKGAKAEKDRAG